MDSINHKIIPYLERVQNKKVRKAIGIISDKQNVFEEIPDTSTHDEKVWSLEHQLFPKQSDYKMEFHRDRMVYYFGDLDRFVFYVPNTINENQYYFLTDLFSKLLSAKRNICPNLEINFISRRSNIKIDQDTSYSSIVEQLLQLRKDYILHDSEERIIGEELPNDIAVNNIINMSKILYCKDSKDLEGSFLLLLGLYKDDYYKKYIDHIFPKFSIFSKLNSCSFHGIEDEINQRMRNASNLSQIFEVLLYGVYHHLKNDLFYHERCLEEYTSYHDKRYQKEIIDIRGNIDDDLDMLRKIESTVKNKKDLNDMLKEKSVVSSLTDEEIKNFKW